MRITFFSIPAEFINIRTIGSCISSFNSWSRTVWIHISFNLIIPTRITVVARIIFVITSNCFRLITLVTCPIVFLCIPHIVFTIIIDSWYQIDCNIINITFFKGSRYILTDTFLDFSNRIFDIIVNRKVMRSRSNDHIRGILF